MKLDLLMEIYAILLNSVKFKVGQVMSGSSETGTDGI
jgi:hypothetical protein